MAWCEVGDSIMLVVLLIAVVLISELLDIFEDELSYVVKP